MNINIEEIAACSVQGCDQFAKVRGYCLTHYQKARKDGLPREYQRRLTVEAMSSTRPSLARIKQIVGHDITEFYLRRSEVVPFVWHQVQAVLRESDTCILVLPADDLVPHALKPTNADLYISLGQYLGCLDKCCTPDDVSAMIYGG